MSRIDGILAEIREYGGLSMDEQAELIQRLRDGEGDNHKPAGQWVARGRTEVTIDAEGNGFNVDWIHGPDVPMTQGLRLTFYHGQMDGKPVIQIDGSADFRINVNDCPVWDQSTDFGYVMPEELRESKAIERARRKVWVGTIEDQYGTFVYVGATEQALFANMRSNYGEIEFREESNREWIKRADDAGATVTHNSYYVEGEE